MTRSGTGWVVSDRANRSEKPHGLGRSKVTRGRRENVQVWIYPRGEGTLPMTAPTLGLSGEENQSTGRRPPEQMGRSGRRDLEKSVNRRRLLIRHRKTIYSPMLSLDPRASGAMEEKRLPVSNNVKRSNTGGELRIMTREGNWPRHDEKMKTVPDETLMKG